MSYLTCIACDSIWDAGRSPYCPKCIAGQWATSPNLIKPKHDPSVLPSGYPSFRSVVTEDVVERKPEFLEYTAASGDWYFSEKHKKFCVFTPDPLGIIPGSGIPKGATMPTHALDGLVLADATRDAHLYTADQVAFRQEVRKGQYQPLTRCSASGCINLAIPDEQHCAQHRGSPLGK